MVVLLCSSLDLLAGVAREESSYVRRLCSSSFLGVPEGGVPNCRMACGAWKDQQISRVSMVAALPFIVICFLWDARVRASDGCCWLALRWLSGALSLLAVSLALAVFEG
ncbi:unnamed protein product [Linum trigynum]|uniref:Uncharacterized protein n=1 Tax=Linum trigynum TaxID=586398 RepID=A0AAV2DCU7_9ROSI